MLPLLTLAVSTVLRYCLSVTSFMNPHDPIQPGATRSQADIMGTIAHHEPGFFRYVEQVQKSNGSAVLCLAMSQSEQDGWHSSAHQKEVLCACLWYALEQGVVVTVTSQAIISRASESENKLPCSTSSGQQ